MKKQATFNTILDSFQSFLKETGENKTAAEVPSEQGRSENSVSTPAKDSEVNEILPNGGNKPSGGGNPKIEALGAEAEEKVTGQPTGIPEQHLERREQSVSTKIARDLSTDELVARVMAGLKKTASTELPEKEVKEIIPAPGENKNTKVNELGAEAEEKLPGQPSLEKAPGSDETSGEKIASPTITTQLTVDELVQKTAAFLQQSEQGYNFVKAIFEDSKFNKQASVIPAELSNVNVEELVNGRVEQLKTAGYNDDQIAAQLEADGRADAEYITQKNAIEENARQKIASYVYDNVAAEVASGTLSPYQAGAVLTKLGYDVQAEEAMRAAEAAINQKVAQWQSEGKNESEIAVLIKQAAEADAAQAGQANEQQMAQQLHQVVTELQGAVEQGQITEDQALDMLRQSGLDVDGLLQALQAQGGAPEGGEAGPTPDAVNNPAGAPEAPNESPEHEAKESPEEEAAEKATGEEVKPKEESEPKEEKKEAGAEGLPGGMGSPDPAAGGAPDAGAAGAAAGQLPPQIAQVIQALDQALQSGAIDEQQAQAAVQALLAGGGAPGGAPEGAPAPAPAPEAGPAPIGAV